MVPRPTSTQAKQHLKSDITRQIHQTSTAITITLIIIITTIILAITTKRNPKQHHG